MSDTNHNINISNISIFRVLLWGTGLYALFYFKELIIILIIAIFFSVILEPAISMIRKIRIFRWSPGRILSVFALFLIVFAVIILTAYYLLPIIIQDIIILAKKLPKALEGWTVLQDSSIVSYFMATINQYADVLSIEQVISGIKSSIFGLGKVWTSTGAVLQNIINLLLTIIFTFYFSIEEKGVENVLRMISPSDKSAYIISLWNRAEKKIVDWATGQFIAAVIIGLMVLVALLIAKMPYAGLFAVLSFAGEMIPLVGLLLSSIPAIIVAGVLIGVDYAVIITLIFFIIAQIENYIVYPKIMSNRVGVPSLVVLLSILIGLKLLGFWGVVLAVPVAAVIIEYMRDLRRVHN